MGLFNKKNKHARPTVRKAEKKGKNGKKPVIDSLPTIDSDIPTGAAHASMPQAAKPSALDVPEASSNDVTQDKDVTQVLNIPKVTEEDATRPSIPEEKIIKEEDVPTLMTGTEVRKEKKKKKKRKKILITLLIIFVSILLATGIGGYIYLYFTDAFKIQNIEINGVHHLTDDEMEKLADVPKDTTLLKVDTDTIKKRLKRDAWIHDVTIEKKFPNTLTINVTERSITAIVEVPTSASEVNTAKKNQNSVVRNWAISADHVWLMPVPDKNSEAAKNINQQIYHDVEGVMHIVDVSPSVQPEIGATCTDDIVNCAIDVVASMTTELKNQVAFVKAADSSSTNLILKNGVEISIGNSEEIRDKERVCLELLKKYDGKISYINVRNPSSPTWRMF